jgi:hypothetical protein
VVVHLANINHQLLDLCTEVKHLVKTLWAACAALE